MVFQSFNLFSNLSIIENVIVAPMDLLGVSRTEAYREGFLKFIDPENIRESLKQERILAYRYLAQRDGKEYYEMIRAASVSSSGKDEETEVHAVGIGMTVIDEEMRQTMAQQQALSDALAAAEQENGISLQYEP